MSKTILTEVEGFTPLIDNLVQNLGLTTAAVFGKVWRFCQMKNGVCTASQQRIAEELGLKRETANRHIQKLIEHGYLKDVTPEEYKGSTRIIADTGKAGIVAKISAKSDDGV